MIAAQRTVTRGMAMTRRARRVLFGAPSPKPKQQQQQRAAGKRSRDRSAAAEPARELVPIPVLANPLCCEDDENYFHCVLQWSVASTADAARSSSEHYFK
mmetsp:Transcript_9441/g.22149  ORF Transcript_9441/g.22149 Transcript_9441/m.22149 type:complete len:100 (+) Transcript_9441:97-396(+)